MEGVLAYHYVLEGVPKLIELHICFDKGARKCEWLVQVSWWVLYGLYKAFVLQGISGSNLWPSIYDSVTINF